MMIEEYDRSGGASKDLHEVSLAIVAPAAVVTESFRWSIITSLTGLLRDFEYVLLLCTIQSLANCKTTNQLLPLSLAVDQ